MHFDNCKPITARASPVFYYDLRGVPGRRCYGSEMKKKQTRNLLGINGRESWKWREIYLVPPFRAIQLRNIPGNELESRLSWNFRNTKNQARGFFLPLSPLSPLSPTISLVFLHFLFILRASSRSLTCFSPRFRAFLTCSAHFTNHDAYLRPRDLIRENISRACTLFFFPPRDFLRAAIKNVPSSASLIVHTSESECTQRMHDKNSLVTLPAH